MRNLFLVISLALVNLDTFSSELACSQNGTIFYYVNGVNVEYDEAAIDSDKITSDFVNENASSLDSKSEVKTHLSTTQLEDSLTTSKKFTIRPPAISLESKGNTTI
ncbi:hypothetical protein DOM21_11305 [Bacteriovorax stolpii]|uniref:hypothetical protein n=1 Tax=Bacteriovorax stolpii TaxID=960 RepID=UPI00115B6852|nr:hypothetical protein [Bacteriovorax stolpii]QDK42023.1 hypothetical protein DOM21_11305 [Bacteriovorax stolpii]